MAERNIPPDVVERAAAAGASDIIIEDGGFNEPRIDGHAEPSAAAAAAAAGALAEAPASGALARVSSVTLQVTVNTNYGEEVYICGSDPAIGNWLPADGVKLSTSAEIYPDWFVTLPLPLASRPVRYKYVIKMAADMFTWENRIPDRELVADAEEIFLNDGRFNQIQRQVTPPTVLPTVPPTVASPTIQRQVAVLRAQCVQHTTLGTNWTRPLHFEVPCDTPGLTSRECGVRCLETGDFPEDGEPPGRPQIPPPPPLVLIGHAASLTPY